MALIKICPREEIYYGFVIEVSDTLGLAQLSSHKMTDLFSWFSFAFVWAFSD